MNRPPTRAELLLTNFDLPRTDAKMVELAEAATTLLYVLGPTGRAAIRAHLLTNAEEPLFARCLKVMNDFERIQDWRHKRDTP